MSTWMVVEDEPGIYEVLMAMFQLWGIEGAAFVDGEEAFGWIEEVDSGQFRGELPELALIDIRMPGAIQGNDVAERMRKSPILGSIPIVLTTAYQLTHTQYFGIMAQTQADQLLRKPLPKFEALKRTLEDIIEARRVRGGTNLTDIPPIPPPVRGAPYLPGGARPTPLPAVNHAASSASVHEDRIHDPVTASRDNGAIQESTIHTPIVPPASGDRRSQPPETHPVPPRDEGNKTP